MRESHQKMVGTGGLEGVTCATVMSKPGIVPSGTGTVRREVSNPLDRVAFTDVKPVWACLEVWSFCGLARS